MAQAGKCCIPGKDCKIADGAESCGFSAGRRMSGAQHDPCQWQRSCRLAQRETRHSDRSKCTQAEVLAELGGYGCLKDVFDAFSRRAWNARLLDPSQKPVSAGPARSSGPVLRACLCRLWLHQTFCWVTAGEICSASAHRISRLFRISSPVLLSTRPWRLLTEGAVRRCQEDEHVDLGAKPKGKLPCLLCNM